MIALLDRTDRKSHYQRLQRRRFNKAKDRPLEPLDFCREWIPKLYGIQPDERGFKAESIRELSRITDIGEASISANWGADFSDRPKWVPKVLQREHMLNLVREAVILPPETLDELDNEND